MKAENDLSVAYSHKCATSWRHGHRAVPWHSRENAREKLLGEEILRGLLTRNTEVMTISCTTKQLQSALTTFMQNTEPEPCLQTPASGDPLCYGHWTESVKPTRRTKWVRNAGMQGLWGRRPGPEASGPSRSKFSSRKPQGTVAHSSTQPIPGEQPGAVPGADRTAGKNKQTRFSPGSSGSHQESNDKQDT